MKFKEKLILKESKTIIKEKAGYDDDVSYMFKFGHMSDLFEVTLTTKSDTIKFEDEEMLILSTLDEEVKEKNKKDLKV